MMEHITRLSHASELIAPTSYLLLFPSYFRSYTRPIVASVGSSIAEVIANPLSAW